MKSRLANRFLPAVSAMAVMLSHHAYASQNSLVMPTTGPLSMSDYSADVNAAFDSIASQYNGPSAPGVGIGGQPYTYQFWMDTSTTLKTLRVYDGSTWVGIGTLSTSSHLFQPLNVVKSIGCSTGLIGGTITSTGQCGVDFAQSTDFLAGSAVKALSPASVFIGESTIACSTATTVDLNTAFSFKVSMTCNIGSFTFSNIKAGQQIGLRFVQDVTGGRTIPTNPSTLVHCSSGCNLSLSTAAGAVDYLQISCPSTSYCISGALLKNLTT